MAKQRTGIDTQAPVPTGPSAEEVAAAQKQAAENAPKAEGGRLKGDFVCRAEDADDGLDA
jgi:hypothetical protein